MALHRIRELTIGVPNVADTAAYYQDFGLTRLDDAAAGASTPPSDAASVVRFATADGGEQLRIVRTDRRRLVRLALAADDADDLARIGESLDRRDHPFELTAAGIQTTEPGANIAVEVTVEPRLVQRAAPAPHYNRPGDVQRVDARAEPLDRPEPVRPRRLGHVVIGSTNREATRNFFVEGLGFKISDEVGGLASFMRCSEDHHNVLVQSSPIDFLHHTAWQVDDVDEVGRGATAMLTTDPARHAWGLGRHYLGSNFFWYLRDPAGNFTEYFSDMDCIVDDAVWKPEALSGPKGLYSWGPPPPSDFIEPADIAQMLTSMHSS